jgi:DNA ligase-associated metallophosphoesterase
LISTINCNTEQIMNDYDFTFCNTSCTALPSGALYLPVQQLLCVSDLHLGKSERIARRGGTMLPPYEVQQTLEKLQDDIDRTDPQTVVCLGDSFDDAAAAAHLNDDMRMWLARMQAGRSWVWIEGNHDPGPVNLGGTHRGSLQVGALSLRHIATPALAEVSGHYHPKHRIAGRSVPAFLLGQHRLIMPAYGAYTGGLISNSPALRILFAQAPLAILTGRKAIAVPT